MAELESRPQRFKDQSLDDVEMDYDDSISIETDDDDCIFIQTEAVDDDVYNRYNFNRDLPDLPIVGMKCLILEAIEANPVIILEGATGCGKTTQVRFK